MLDLQFIQSRMQHEPELEHDKPEQQQGCYKQVEGEQVVGEKGERRPGPGPGAKRERVKVVEKCRRRPRGKRPRRRRLGLQSSGRVSGRQKVWTLSPERLLAFSPFCSPVLEPHLRGSETQNMDIFKI